MAGPIRQPIDIAALERYLQDHSDISVPVEVEQVSATASGGGRMGRAADARQFGYGQSNPTYLVRSADGQRYVLRMKPPGRLLNASAHAVEREYRVLAALAGGTAVPVPRALLLCENAAVLGTPFYVMTFVAGRIFSDPAMPGVGASERRLLWTAALTTLAANFHLGYFQACILRACM